MISEVAERNLVTIPASLAQGHGIKPGSRLDWHETDCPDVLSVRILPDYAALATSLMGAGRAQLRPGVDPLTALAQARVREDEERLTSL